MADILRGFSIVSLIGGTVLLVMGVYYYNTIKRLLPYGKALVKGLQVYIPGLMLVYVGAYSVVLYPALDTYDVPPALMTYFEATSLVLLFLGSLVLYDHYVLSDEKGDKQEDAEADPKITDEKIETIE